MWEWLMDELQKAAKVRHAKKGLVNIDIDDVVQNILLMLLDNLEMAKNIYDNKKVDWLYTLVRSEYYAEEAMVLCFENKTDLSRFQRIIAVCEKYDIEPKPQNAYKISALLDDDHNNFTIAMVTRLLSTYEKFAEHKWGNQITKVADD